MPPNYHVGQRVSFKSALCTIRYIGPIKGIDKEWLGVEWDDPTRGKHDGQHKGERYFRCKVFQVRLTIIIFSNILIGKSESPAAASFVPSSTKSDTEQSFVQAVHQKYATEISAQPVSLALDKQIEISGKVVEEVGFDKIRKQQSQLDELKIVIVDGFRISSAEDMDGTIRDVCPKILELDLSRNLFETCKEIIRICGELDNLRSLRLKYILAFGASLQLIANTSS